MLEIAQEFRREREALDITVRRLLLNGVMRAALGNVALAQRISGMSVQNVVWESAGGVRRLGPTDLDPDVVAMMRHHRPKIATRDLETHIEAALRGAGHSMMSADIARAVVAADPEGPLAGTSRHAQQQTVWKALMRSCLFERDPRYKYHWRLRQDEQEEESHES